MQKAPMFGPFSGQHKSALKVLAARALAHAVEETAVEVSQNDEAGDEEGVANEKEA